MQVGTMIAERFEIERFIARGGMGDVYLAHDHQTGDDVALKFIADDMRLVKRMALEARALLELSHPAIVGYVAHGMSGDTGLYLAMEYIEGQTLSARLKEQPLTIEQSLTLAARVADGLGHAHGQGMVHRDIKPLNLYLPRNDSARVKILDFGIVRLSRFQRITATGVGMGTPEYMAPEQARGEKEVGAPADIFALGCVLFKCLTGRTAFPGKRIDAVLAKIAMVDQPPRITEVNPELPAPVDHLVAKMMAYKAEDRPKDGDACNAHIRAVLSALKVGIEPTAQIRIAPSLTKKDLQPISVIFAELRGSDADTIPQEVVLETPDFSPREHSEVGPVPKPPSAGEGEGGVTEEPSGEQLRVFHGSSDVSRLLPAIRRAVEPYNARVEILLNGSLVAMLGGGAAAKDLAARSARCALTIRGMLSDASIGIATKRAVKGDRKSIGPIIDTAAALVRPNSRLILIDKNTRDLLSLRFSVEQETSRSFVLVEEQKREPKPDEPPRLLLGKETPCVGRNRLLRQLEAVFLGCVEDNASESVVVIGKSGVGKSRVVSELVQRLQGKEELAIASARGDNLRARAPYDLVGRALRRFLEIPEGEPDARRNELRARVARLIEEPERVRVTEFLGELAGVNFPAEDSAALRAAHLDPKLMADQKRRAWVDWLRAECATQPLLFIVDDAHWADQLSMELIGYALKEVADQPFMVLASARPEIHDQFPKLADDWNRQEIPLDTLRPSDCDALVREVLSDIDEAVRKRLVERSAGNAFYLEELIRAAAGGDVDALPESVLASVQVRVANLPDGARQVLRAAAVFGRTFWSGGIVALLGIDTSPEEVADWLTALEGEELIERQEGGTLAKQNQYMFRHDITREAVYHMLTDKDRITGHRLAGQWLQDHGEVEPVVLAEHFAGGGAAEKAVELFERAARQALTDSRGLSHGDTPGGGDDSLSALRKAATYFRRAGQASMAAYANLNAVDFFERAVAFWAMLDPAEAVRTQLELVDVRERLDDRSQALADLLRAEHDAERSERSDELMVEILLKQARIEARGQGEGALDRARKLAHRARELAAQFELPVLESRASAELAIVLASYDTEEFGRKAIYYAEQALALKRDHGDISSSLWTLGNVFLLRNDLERASDLYSRAIEAAEAAQNDVLLAACHGNMGLVSFRQWDLDDAINRAETALALYRRIGDRQRITATTLNLGTYYQVRGDGAAAKPLLQEALLSSKGDWIYTTVCQECLADLARHEGDEKLAQTLLQDAAKLCERVGVPQKQSFYLGLLAESYWMTGHVDRAIQCLEQAVEQGEGVTLSHALLMGRMGNYDDAAGWLVGFRSDEPDPDRRVVATLALARIHWWCGEVSEAKQLCADAVATVEPTGVKHHLLPATVLQYCLNGKLDEAMRGLAAARSHCGQHVIGEVALDVGTMLVLDDGAPIAGQYERYLRMTEVTNDFGLAFRVETIRADLLARLGRNEQSIGAKQRARTQAELLVARLPEMHQPMFEEHPWVRAAMRYQVV